MKCPKCGAEIMNDAKFCGTCGSNVSNTTEQVVGQQPQIIQSVQTDITPEASTSGKPNDGISNSNSGRKS